MSYSRFPASRPTTTRCSNAGGTLSSGIRVCAECIPARRAVDSVPLLALLFALLHEAHVFPGSYLAEKLIEVDLSCPIFVT